MCHLKSVFFLYFMVLSLLQRYTVYEGLILQALTPRHNTQIWS